MDSGRGPRTLADERQRGRGSSSQYDQRALVGLLLQAAARPHRAATGLSPPEGPGSASQKARRTRRNR